MTVRTLIAKRTWETSCGLQKPKQISDLDLPLPSPKTEKQGKNHVKLFRAAG